MTTQERAPLLDRERLAELLAQGIEDEVAASAWRLIAEARRILLLAHEHPDPDALGSGLGLAQALRPLGKECVVACADPVPSPMRQTSAKSAKRSAIAEKIRRQRCGLRHVIFASSRQVLACSAHPHGALCFSLSMHDRDLSPHTSRMRGITFSAKSSRDCIRRPVSGAPGF